MKIVVQKSKASRVEVNNEVVGEISSGLVLLVCLENGDDESILEKAIAKILNLRIFPNPASESQKMDLNITQTEGEILAISQFTLSWDGLKGNRPSFDKSMEPKRANILFKIFCDKLRKQVKVETGSFGDHMNVHIINDGPVTFTFSF